MSYETKPPRKVNSFLGLKIGYGKCFALVQFPDSKDPFQNLGKVFEGVQVLKIVKGFRFYVPEPHDVERGL